MNTGVLIVHLLLGLLLILLILGNRTKKRKALTLAAVLLIVLSGAYNFMTRMAAPPKGWHMFIGIKILLALHVLAMALVMMKELPEDKAKKLKRGALLSGLVVMAIGVWFSNFAK